MMTEEPQQNQSDQSSKSLGLPLLVVALIFALSVSTSLAMIIIGSQYSDPILCRLVQVTQFLMIGGAFFLVVDLMRIGTFFGPSNMIVKQISGLLYFTAIIYGTVVVCGKFSTWESKDPISDTYCDSKPYILALATVVFHWTMLLLNCLCCFLYLAAFGKPQTDPEQQASN